MPRAYLLLAGFVTVLAACGPSAQSGRDQAAPGTDLQDPQASPLPTPPVKLTSVEAHFDVHGGDGDGSIAIWWVRVDATLHNAGSEPVKLGGVSWSMKEIELAKEESLDETIAPGHSISIGSDKVIGLEKLQLLRQWKEEGHSETLVKMEVSLANMEALQIERRVQLSIW